MGYDQMEREFPCPCGKGTILASWEEHDTWPSPNRSIDWAFKCSDCEKQFCFGGLFSADYILRLEDAEKAGELRMRQEKARNAVYDFAGPLYEEKWLAYVGSLGTKRAMNDAIGGGGYGTFLNK